MEDADVDDEDDIFKQSDQILLESNITEHSEEKAILATLQSLAALESKGTSLETQLLFRGFLSLVLTIFSVFDKI